MARIHATIHQPDLNLFNGACSGGIRWIDLGGDASLFVTSPDEVAALIAAAAQVLRSFDLTKGEVAHLLEGTGLTPELRSNGPKTAAEHLS